MSSKQNTREAIVDTASKLFFSQGYHATGLNQIIKDSDSPKGSLYYYFPHGKEELALTCINRMSDIVVQKLKKYLDNSDKVAAAMEDFILGMANDAIKSSYEGIIPFSFWLGVETSCVSDELRTACKSVFRNMQDVIRERLLKEGVEDKTADDKASVIVSLYEGALLQTLIFRNEQPLVAAARMIPAILG